MSSSSNKPTGPRVLVVDDNPANVDLLSRRLERDGYAVSTLTNALTLENDILQIQPDVILLDWMMPERSGVEALRAIRKTHDSNRMPVIMVTARGEGDSVSEAIEAGANDYVTKPIDFVVLRSRLNGVLVRRLGVLETDTANEQLEARVAQRTMELQQANSRMREEIAERIKAESRANRLARIDVLTGLPNRLHFMERLKSLASRSGAEFEPFSLIQVNIDRFRTINTVHGSDTGDEVLREVASRLRSAAQDCDLVARTAADEFSIILPVSARAGPDAARAIRNDLAIPVCVNGRKLAISCSIAVTRSGSQLSDADAILLECDSALAQAKLSGGGEVYCYDERLAQTIREHAVIKRELAEGIPKGEIIPFFQPTVNFATGEVTSAEVLARWQHPRRGMVGPIDFIPAAEETGLVDDLFWAMLPAACAEVLRVSPTARIAVNLSPSQILDQWFPEKVLQCLTKSGLPPARLEIEMTETALFSDIKATKLALQSLNNQGVRIALDDFGVGYSSLALIRELPIAKVKIDRSFVAGIDSDASAAALVKGMIDFCDALGLETTAEGIEEAAVAHRLSEWGCTYGQGYWLGRPAPQFALQTPWSQQLARKVA
jgi:diguanylate cyclase (GGDEF)-like protein